MRKWTGNGRDCMQALALISWPVDNHVSLGRFYRFLQSSRVETLCLNRRAHSALHKGAD